MPPQALELIERAGFRREYVDQVVAIIRQDPFSVREAFHADRIFATLIELLANFFHNGLDLLGIASAADDEKIREGSYFTQVQNPNVDGFLRFSGSNGGKPRGSSERQCSRMRGRVVMLSDS
jgi:hypothetical protein